MASSEAFKPITTIQEPSIQGLPRFYTSTREVPAEWEPPVRGTVIGPILGPRYKLHIVLDASVQPSQGKLVATITHCSPAAWNILLSTVDRDGIDVFLLKKQVVPAPTQDDVEAAFLSTFEPIDEAKSLKTTKVPRRRTTTGTFEDGYSQKQKKSKGVESLTPQKFKRLTDTITTTTQEALPAANVNDIPEPPTPSGDQTIIEHEKVTDHRYEKRVTAEVIDTNASPLVGQEYGDIVTKDVSERLVADGTSADTGMQVISSTVEPLGNGKSVKTTKTAHGNWPDPVEKEIAKDATHSPPPRYLRDLTRTTSKSKVASVPTSVTLSTGEIAKSYKKETPDRAEQSVTTEALNLNLTPVDEKVDQKPFVKITSVMTPGVAKVVPANRNGSANLVYDNGTAQIWENVEEIAVARERSAGSEKDKKPFVSIERDKRYSASDAITTATGSANVIFDDGTVQVYEVTEVHSTGKYGAAGAEQQSKPFVKITSTATYQEDGALDSGEVGSTNKVYDDGETVVYEKKVDTAVARPGLKGIETNAQQWGAIKSTINYTESSNPPSGGSVQVIFSDGSVTVYEATSTEALVSGSTKDIDPQQWGSVTWDGTYDITSDGTRSRQVWSNGVLRVFHNETPTLHISGGSIEKDSQQWGSVTWNGTYGTSSSGDRSRKVAQIGEHEVYHNETATVSISGVGTDIEPREWGSLVWHGSYSSVSGGDKSRKVATIAGSDVYLNEDAELRVDPGSFISAREENALLTEVQTTSYSTSPNSGTNTRSRVAFSLAGNKVYENITITRTAKAHRFYPGLANVDLPPIFTGFDYQLVTRRDGQDSYIYTPFVSSGFRGPMVCEVEEYWSENPGVDIEPTTFKPNSMEFKMPLGGFSVGACLHGYVEVSQTVGTKHPTYLFNEYLVYYDATSPPTWEGLKIVAHVDTQPYREGFVVRIFRVQL